MEYKTKCCNYLLSVNGHIWVADANQNRDKGGYEWYYWEGVPARCFGVEAENLYFGTEDGRLCMMNNDLTDEEGQRLMEAYSDNGAAIEWEWRTRMDSLNGPTVNKTLQKRGNGILFKSMSRAEAEVYFCTERDGEGQFVETVQTDRFSFSDIDFSRFLRSKDAQKLYQGRKSIYADKINAFGSADELLKTSKDYIGESLKHKRKDNFKEFARGKVRFKVGANGYLLPPFGGGAVKRAAEGAQAVHQGGVYGMDDEGNRTLKFPVYGQKPGDYARAMLFGRYSLPTGREYIDSGFKGGLNAKESRAFKAARNG